VRHAILYTAFSEVHGIRVSSDIAELAGFGIPQTILTAWANLFPGGLNALQLQAVNDRRVLDGASLNFSRSLLLIAEFSEADRYRSGGLLGAGGAIIGADSR
jgi:hypothetical protein